MRNIESQREQIKVSKAVPMVSIRGKAFTAVEPVDRIQHEIGEYDKDTKSLYIDAVIVEINPRRSKAFFKGGYKENTSGFPVCYSEDSIKPADDSEERQSLTCGICVNNEFKEHTRPDGSKFKGKLCKDSQKVALMIPAYDKAQLFMLRIPAGSLKQFTHLITSLRKYPVNGKAALPIQVLVRISFEKTEYPSLLFRVMEVLPPDGEVYKAAEALFQKSEGLELVGVEPPKLIEGPKMPVEIPEHNSPSQELLTSIPEPQESDNDALRQTLKELPRRRAA